MEEFVELEELNTIELFNKKIMVLCDDVITEDTLADLAIINIIDSQPYVFGTIITTGDKISDFYKRFIENNPDSDKIKIGYLYRRYTFLINKKIFKNNTYFLLDNYSYSQQQLQSIISKINDANMMSIFSYPYIIKDDSINYDYYFITCYTDKESIQYIYNNFVKKENFKEFLDFFTIIIDCIDNEIVVVIDVNNNKILAYDMSFD